MIAERRWPDGIMVVMPSDHLIQNREGFVDTITRAAERAKRGEFVTIGIPPTYPATVYGYLHLKSNPAGDGAAIPLHAFVEKPDRARAEEFLATGRYLWNSGIFIWKTTVILESVQTHLPDLYEKMTPVVHALHTEKFQKAVREAFETATPISIDYGVM
jgi:mannose-1-phosphate guanylyltransferase